MLTFENRKCYVIGFIDGHTWADVSAWYLSLKRTGFDGSVILGVYEGVNVASRRRFERRGIQVLTLKRAVGVNQDRHRDLAEFASSVNPTDVVLTTDVRDVYFQRNPAGLFVEMIENGKQLLIASEGWKYRDSPPNLNELRSHFPSMEAELSDSVVFCAGAWGGAASSVAEFCRSVSHLLKNAHHVGGDQTALNLLLNRCSGAESDQWWRINVSDGKICHYAVAGDYFRDHFATVGIEPAPVFHFMRGFAATSEGIVPYILHQYTQDRLARIRLLLKSRAALPFFVGKLFHL